MPGWPLWWPSGFPYFLQFQPEFCNKEFMIWATVSSQSCFCWLHRASPSLAAKNIISLILVLTIWWCPCVEASHVQEGSIWEALPYKSCFGFGVPNEASQRLLEFYQENALVVANTLFQQHIDWLYSLQPKREKLYTVNKNKTRSWLWLRSWTPYYQIQT